MSLTKKQRKILDAIVFLIRRGEIPTVREVGALVGLRSPSTVLKHLRALEAEGLITTTGKSRGIRIADPDLLVALLEDAGFEGAGSGDAGSREKESPVAQSPVPESPVAESPVAESPVAAPSGRDPDSGELSRQEGGRREAAEKEGFAAERFMAERFMAEGRQSNVSRKNAEKDAPEKKEDDPDAPLPPSSGVSRAGPPFHELDAEKLRSATTRDAYERVRETVTARGNILQAHFHRLSGGGGVPVVGAIAAGRPIETRAEAFAPGASFDDQPRLALDPRMFAESGKLFALRIEGNSMVGAGILDGDYAIIRRQEEIEEGEIAAVLIDGEATLKRWHFRSSEPSREGDADTTEDFLQEEEEREGKVRLVAANDRFDPLEITEIDRKEVIVVGKYVGLVRGARMP